MDPLTVILVTVLLATGIPMTGYISYGAYRRLEWNKTHDPWYTTTTTTTRRTTTTVQTTTTRSPTYTRRRLRREPQRWQARWLLIPTILTVTLMTKPSLDGWDKMTNKYPNLHMNGWGYLIPLGASAIYLIKSALRT